MGMSILQPAKPSTPARCSGPQRYIQLVYLNGSAHIFTEAISAGEALQSSLLQQHNKTHMSSMHFNNFLVCDSVSLHVGKRASPMHGDMWLEVGHLYYALPIRSFQHRLSWSHICSLAAMATNASASSSIAAAHMLTYRKSLPSPKRGPIARAFGIPDVKFFLQSLLLRRRFRIGGGRRVDDMDAASRRAGVSAHSVLHTQAKRAVGARVLSSKCREPSQPFNNICDNPEMNTKYVEHLIDRSRSWRPPLLTIQESIAV